MKKEKQIITTFEEAEGYLNETPRFTAKNHPEATKAFLHRLGDPDRKMHIIHVAGTNGKGSVCAYLRSILEAAGYKVALFTSPHLVDIRERFIVEGEMISREVFLQVFLQIYELLDWDALEAGNEKAYHPTYFEYLFFIAMVYFAERKPDFCILETGLGGRLDATNAVSRKDISIITHISLDHVEWKTMFPMKHLWIIHSQIRQNLKRILPHSLIPKKDALRRASFIYCTQINISCSTRTPSVSVPHTCAT